LEGCFISNNGALKSLKCNILRKKSEVIRKITLCFTNT